MLSKVLIITGLIVLTSLLTQVSQLLGVDHIIYLDIGQGDSTLVCNRFKHCGLIDTGKQSNVINKLRDYSSAPLEFIILTHPDFDHTGETIDIVKNFGVKNIFINQTLKSQPLIDQILKLNLTSVSVLRSNNSFTFADYRFNVFWPDVSVSLNELESNETSVGLLISNKQDTFYQAGDLGAKWEEFNQLKAHIENIDIAKLSHHGSKNSSSKTFLNIMNPRLSIISVGKNNYGHPSTQVLNNLSTLSLNYLRTDISGDITVNISNNKLELFTSKNKKSYIILN